ncbi:FHA domain-containing protein, partial [Actinomyces bowdenii]
EGEAGRSTTVIPAALAALGAAPIVLASLCPRGHANPPDLGQCVRCGHALRGDFRQVPRPVLVTLSISSGEEVPVAGDIVVGRAPQPPVGADAHLVALVSVPSTTHLVSRSHLIFTTAEWNVFVQDLGSSNGTVLARPGHAAVLLPPYVPTPLLVGDLLDVGDGVTIHVEAPR